jgi:hypothetical protein
MTTNTTKRYSGGCDCGAVRFSVDLDLSAGTTRCNCSFCRKAAQWGAMVKPAAFTLESGRDALSDYQRGARTTHLYFCKHCGVRSFSHGDAPWMGGEYYGINLNCVDGIEPAGLTVMHFNGRDNDWESPRIEVLGQADRERRVEIASPAS